MFFCNTITIIEENLHYTKGGSRIFLQGGPTGFFSKGRGPRVSEPFQGGRTLSPAQLEPLMNTHTPLTYLH